jgi:hypothetical protein
MTERIITYHIWPHTLAVHEFVRWPESFAKTRGLIKPGYIYHQLTIDRHESIRCENTSEIAEVLKQRTEFVRLSASETWADPDKDGRTLKSILSVERDSIDVSLESNDIDLMNAAHTAIKDQFNLRNPPITTRDQARVKKLQATVFLGRHFDKETGATASILRKFLSLVGFEVIEGEEFNSQVIPEKVKRQIETQDVYIGLVTGIQEHDWITAEVAYAHGKEKHIILIVEDRSSFRPTIMGHDFEHIPFKIGAIEQAFIKLLEEFRSVGVCGMF